MTSEAGAKAGLKERLNSEVREFTIVAAYLFVYFVALLYLKSAVLKTYGIAFAPFTFALVKAMICAKFVLLGRMLHVGERFKNRPLAWPVLYKSAAFLVLLLILNAIEEILVGLLHHRTVLDTVTELTGGRLDQLVATSFMGLLILIPFFAFEALAEEMGPGVLVRMFFGPRRRTDRP